MRLYELRFKCIETFPIAEMENYNKFTIDDWKNPGLSLETFLYLYFDHHLILLCTFSQADSDNKLRPEDQLTSGSCSRTRSVPAPTSVWGDNRQHTGQ